MTVVTLRPASTLLVSGAAVVGAPNTQTALSDNSDASYMDHSVNGYVDLTLTALPSLPAGALITGYRTAIREYTVNTPGPSQWRTLVRNFANWEESQTYFSGNSSAYTQYSPWFNQFFTAAGIADRKVLVQRYYNNGRLQELYFDVRYVEKPTLVVDEPTGTITDTNVPTVSWTPTLDADGGPQYEFEVRVFTPAQYGITGFDPKTSPATTESGVITSPTARSWTSTVPLADGTYRAYVRLDQQVLYANGTASYPLADWEFSQFTINVDLPAEPTIAATPDDTTGSISLLVTAGSGGLATTDVMELQRLDPVTLLWGPVRTTDGNDGVTPASPATVVDYEASNAVATTYRARAGHDYSGLYAYSDWVQSTPATWTSARTFIKHPNLPALNWVGDLRTYGEIQHTARQGVFSVLGAARPIIVQDERSDATGQLVVRCDTDPSFNALKALVQAGGTLLLQVPAGSGEPDRYIVVGDLTGTRLVDSASFHLRDVSLPWWQVDSPDGGRAATAALLEAAVVTPAPDPGSSVDGGTV